MCRAVKCRICGRTTWAGCGQHVDQVLAGVHPSERCAGHTDAEKAAARRGTLLGRLFGRR